LGEFALDEDEGPRAFQRLGLNNRGQHVRSPSLSRRVALAGGYTAGHIMPMIAVGEAYAECCPGARIIAVGEKYGLEARLLPERGFAFHAIDAAPFFGATTPAGLKRAAAALYRGFWRARRILKNAGTEIVRP
jgi:UDP-N-acetylglucosamine--N-acetylmuramyl-(pentapeptide) pyrophosphoryl-undecaprenol N-acetylglucosamine transferase